MHSGTDNPNLTLRELNTNHPKQIELDIEKYPKIQTS